MIALAALKAPLAATAPVSAGLRASLESLLMAEAGHPYDA
jgi:hypothetical protein